MAQIQGWQPALGEGLAEMLITELTKLKKFQVLESTALKDLKDEIGLGQEGWVGEAERVEKGGFAGADFMFRGKVTRFGSKAQNLDLGGFAPRALGGLGVKTTNSDVRIDWRIVDAYTRKIITSGQAVASESGMGFKIGVNVGGHGGGIGFNNKEFMNSALGKATVKAIDSIMADVRTLDIPESGRHKAKVSAGDTQAAGAKAALDALRNTPGKVLAAPAKGVVIVSLGSKQGFKNGDKLNLYETVDTKDDKGTVVFTEEKLVGEITLDAVQEERSKAIYSGDAAVKSGWVVRVK
jgi:curli biogenesis system outer membrane secretion channel CsgG